ncbi:MAG: hypothetical protein ABR568_24555, partial [Pyrinomonadaceae bacterium]
VSDRDAYGNLQEGGNAKRAPLKPHSHLTLHSQLKLRKFAGWEGGQSEARPRSSAASFPG